MTIGDVLSGLAADFGTEQLRAVADITVVWPDHWSGRFALGIGSLTLTESQATMLRDQMRYQITKLAESRPAEVA